MRPVAYFNSNEAVLLGDIVTTRIFIFFRRKARVVYVPGISKKRSSLEHNGLTWVGLQELNGGFFQGALVDPQNGHLDKAVKLIERGEPVVLPETPDPFIEPGEILDDEDGRSKRD